MNQMDSVRNPSKPTVEQLMSGEDEMQRRCSSPIAPSIVRNFDHEEDQSPHIRKSVLAKVKEKAKKWRSNLGKKKHGNDGANATPAWGVSLEEEDEEDPEYHGAPMYESEMALDDYKHAAVQQSTQSTPPPVLTERDLLVPKATACGNTKKNENKPVTESVTENIAPACAMVSNTIAPARTAVSEMTQKISSKIKGAPAEGKVADGELASKIKDAPAKSKVADGELASKIKGAPAKSKVADGELSSKIKGAPAEEKVAGLELASKIKDAPAKAKVEGGELASKIKGAPAKSKVADGELASKIKAAPTKEKVVDGELALKIKGAPVKEKVENGELASKIKGAASEAKVADGELPWKSKGAVADGEGSRNTEHIWDRGVSVKEYLMHKLEPGEDERALSQVISEAMSPKSGNNGEMGVVEKVKEAVSSLLQVEEEQQSSKDMAAIPNHAEIIEEKQERRLQSN